MTEGDDKDEGGDYTVITHNTRESKEGGGDGEVLYPRGRGNLPILI